MATGPLCGIEQLPDTYAIDIGPDAVTEVNALPGLIQSRAGSISIQGLDAGTEVSV